MLARGSVLSLLGISSASCLHASVALSRTQAVARFRVGVPLMAAKSSSSVFRNPHNLPVKTCVVCNRPFTWRKKWESCWDEVTTCSKKCNGERKKQNRIARGAERAEADASGSDSEDSTGMAAPLQAVALADNEDPKAARKAAKKAAKAQRRARREGEDTGGQKACDYCNKGVDLLIRCQTDETKDWKMVCGRCWKTPEVAGGVVDGDGTNPHYRYGGLWKNLHRAAA